jgi:hypothetical protein
MASSCSKVAGLETKISVELPQDENGYPPDRWESVWANEVQPGVYAIDNVPFFIRGISSGDLVEAKDEGEGLVFCKLVRASGNSVVRLYISDASQVQNVRAEFMALGCESELSHLPKLISLEVPEDVPFGPVAELVSAGQELGR